MIKKLLILMTALVLALNIQTAKSQSCNFTIGENISDTTHTHLTTLITCCKYGVKYTVINHGGSLACPVSLSINLPDEITLDSTGYAVTSSNAAVVAHSFANLAIPHFMVTGTSSGYWNTNDSITFTFTLKTACCMPLTNSGHTFISVDTNRCSDTTATGITVVAPVLDAQSIYPGSHINLFGNTGDALDLVFEIKNGGTLPINQFVNTVCPPESGLTMLGYFFSKTNNTTTDLNKNFCNYYQPSNFVAGTYTVISADSNVYDSLFGVKYFPIDSLYLHIIYKIVACNMTSTPDTFILFCSNGTGSASCFPGELISSSVAVFAGIPMVNASLTQPKYIDSSRANYCNGGDSAINLGLNFINKGSDVSGGAKGNGRAEQLKLFFYTSNEIGSMDTASLRINGYHYAWPAGFVTSVPDIGYSKWKIDFTKWHWVCGDPLPFGANSIADLNGDGKLDDLADSTGQDTIHLTANFKYTTTCPASFSNCGNTVDQIFWGGATFQNECNTLTNDTVGNGDGYAYNVAHGGTTQLNLLSGHDVVAGQTSYFQICPGMNIQEWSDTGFKFICAHPDHRVIVNLPPGYNVNFSDPLITGNTLSNYVLLTSTPCGCHNDSIKPLIKQVTFGCTTNQAIIDFGLLPKCNCNVAYLSYDISCFTIPISLNCNSCTSSSRGWDNITFTLDYFCDTSTCLSCGSEISCASNVAFHHCSGGCDTVGNDFNANPPFTFRRQTLGWLNTPPSNYYDNCNNPVLPTYNVDSVASIDSTIRLDRAYPGDEILAAETGSLSRALGNFDTVMFQVNYTDAYWTPGWFAAPNVFVFDSLLSSITVVSSNHDTAVIKYPNLQHIDQVLGDGKVEMSFRFSADSTADTLLKRMLPPYSLSSRIFLVAKTRPFVSGNTFYHTGAYPVNDLQASFRGTYHDWRDTDNSCDPWTANFTMLQPGFSLDVYGNGSRADGYFAACNQLFEELRVESSPALYPNIDFPNEYRPFITEDQNFTLVCPAGYKFDSAYFTMVQDKYNATGINRFTVNDSLKTYNYRISPATISITGDTLTYNGPNHGCFPVLDCKNFGLGYWNNYQLSSYFTPNCDAPDTTYFKAYTGYTTSVQQSDSFYMNHFNMPSTDQIIRETPTFSCAVASTENLCTDTVSFTLTLANLSGAVNAPYSWISLEQSDPSNPAVTFISATNAIYYDTYSGSNMFIMLDSINTLQSRTIKVTVRVDTASGYGCVNSLTPYPITIAYGNVCTNSPAITQPDTLKGCQFGSTTFTFDLYPSKLSLNQIDSTFIDTLFCGNFLKYTLEISNSDYNTLYNPTFFANLPPGVGLDSVIFKYPDFTTGAYFPFTTDDNAHNTGNLSWNFSTDALGITGGLPGFCHSHDSNDVVLATVYLYTNCNFNNSVNPITFFSTGISPCGKTIYSDSVSDHPIISSSTCPSVSMSSTNDSCNGQSNGTAWAIVSGGRTPYIYVWNPGSLTTDTITGLSAGTYTVTVTDSKGCVVVDSVTITQPNILTDSMGIASNINCNTGTLASAFTKVSGGTAPYTYAWSPIGQTGDTATGLSIGTYTVTITDKNGCSMIDSVTIQALTIGFKKVDTIFCGSDTGFAMTYTQGGTPPYTYLWSNGDSTAIVSGLTPGSYTVVVTDSLGCQAKDSLTVTGCRCYLSKTYDLIINDSSASSIHAGPTTYSCMNILIIGTYTVDEDVTIINCNVEFAPYAMINVINNKTLHISLGSSCSGFNCPHLYAACDTMWRGIFINPGSTVFINKIALIEDADSALVSINSGTAQGLYYASGVTFNKNYKDIVVETCPATYNGEANSCLFTCRDLSAITPCNYYYDYNSAPFTSLLPPYSLPYSYMGIDIDTVRNITVSFGDIFDNKQYGICAHASSLTVISNLFKNIGFTAGYGAGVIDSGMYDHINKEFLVVDSDNFYNCYNGIIASDWFTKVTVLSDVFIDSISPPGVYGVYVTDMGYPYPNPLNIQENTISNFNTGIEADINNYVNANINYNNISESSCDASITWKGISINEFPHSPCLYNVDENNISSINYGIIAVGVQNSVINDNTITLGAVGCPVINGAGIGMKANGKASQIGCNYISTPDTINSYTGIVESQSINTLIINNTTNLTDLHIRFNSTPFNGDNLYDNNLNTGSTGILASAGAMVAASFGTPFDPSDNIFTSFAVCQVNAPFSLKYYWHSTDPFGCTGYAHVHLAILGSNPCLIPPSPPIILRSDSLAHATDSLPTVMDSATVAAMKNTALSKDTFTVLQDTNMPLAKKGVAAALAQHTYLLSDPVFQHFNDSISSASMGQILAIDTTAASASSSIDYSGLLNNLSAITPASNIEANMQISARGFLNYKMNHTLSPSQLAILRNLANKCPDWDGVGVYEARAILSRFDPPGTEYSDSCNTRNEHSVHKKTEKTQTVSQPTFSLYPNPNNGNFTLEYNLGEGILGKVILFNTIGEQVGEYQLNGSSGKLNISNPELSNGVYIWKLYSNAQIIKFGKVIIIK